MVLECRRMLAIKTRQCKNNTMQKNLLCVILWLFIFSVKASPLTFHPRFTNSFRFVASDIWNTDVQFSGTSNLNAYFIATLSTGGKPICTIKSGVVVLIPGVQSFTAATVNTAQLTYHSQAIADIESITGTFPSGTYSICYNAYCVTGNCDGMGPDALYNEYPECFEFVVEPPTPILLAIPEDNAELDWNRPTFNWIPPMPISTVPGFNYHYILVERNKKQTCPDALTRNRPIYYQRGIGQPILPYPAELNDLDTGKIYCWKVNGLVEGVPVAQSEVWEFRIKPKEVEKKDTLKYAKFTPAVSAGNVQLKKNTALFFVCSGSYSGEFLKLRITGDNNFSYVLENAGVSVEKVDISRPDEFHNVLQHFGVNKYSLDLDKVAGLIEGYYTLEIMGENHIPYFLKIQIIN